jgi:hypothetical protein
MAYIHPQTWPEPSRKPRVLVENPDGAELWAHADILREAGYEVATCAGPAEPASWHQRPTTCPLVGEGRCPLAEGADVVVTTTDLRDGAEIVAALGTSVPAALVVETRPGEQPKTARERVLIEGPVTEERLLEAVAASLR